MRTKYYNLFPVFSIIIIIITMAITLTIISDAKRFVTRAVDIGNKIPAHIIHNTIIMLLLLLLRIHFNNI